MSLPHVCVCEKCRREMGGVIPLIDPVKLLAGNLRLAEEGLANYAQENQKLRDCWTEALANYAKQNTEVERLRQENERLQDEDRIWEKHGLVQIVWERDQLRALLTQAPIAKVTVREGCMANAPDDVYVKLYAPGLPPGEHDLYLMPSVPQPEEHS